MLTPLVLAAVLAQAPTPTPTPAAFAPKVTPYGYLNFQYSRLDASEPKADPGTFEFRRARLGLKGEVTPHVGFAVLYDGADGQLKDAFATLRYVPGVELRLGQFKTPFGYEQPESDTKLLWVYSSYAVQALARGRDSRDVGALATGRWKVGGAAAVDASAAYVNGAGPNAKDDLDEKNVWTRAGVSVALAGTTTRLGGSYGHGRQASYGADGKFGPQGTGASATLDDTWFWFHAAGADLTFDSPWVYVAAEWMQSRRHVTRFTAPAASATTDIVPRGWYAGLYTRSPWNAGFILRVEEARLADSTGTALNARWNRRATVGAYADAVPLNARLILNYERDASPRALRTGDRLVLFGQVMF